MTIHIVKQSSKFIKPSNPTPPNLRHLKIGFIDEFPPSMNVSIVLFFSINSHNDPKFITQLEESLQKTLIQFYPLVGRYVVETRTIDCNDQGVDFMHAKVNIKLQDFLDSEVSVKCVDKFIPREIGEADLITDPILAIQVTTFECGGIALGVSISHRIADVSTLSTFLIEWATINREEKMIEFTRPCFNSSLFFPSRGLPSLELGFSRSIQDDDVINKNVIKKLSFSDSEISNFKEKVALNGRNGTPQWSKVQLVSAIILKAFIGIDRAIHDDPRDCTLIHVINLRERTTSLIPKDSCGNLWGIISTECGVVETTEALADLLRDSFKNTMNNYLKVSHENEEEQTMVLNSFLHLGHIPQTTNVVRMSSWCKFPFYEVEFGFGKPIRVNPGSVPLKNSAFFMDGVGGNGVEAYVCMETKDVPYFEESIDIKALVG